MFFLCLIQKTCCFDHISVNATKIDTLLVSSFASAFYFLRWVIFFLSNDFFWKLKVKDKPLRTDKNRDVPKIPELRIQTFLYFWKAGTCTFVGLESFCIHILLWPHQWAIMGYFCFLCIISQRNRDTCGI